MSSINENGISSTPSASSKSGSCRRLRSSPRLRSTVNNNMNDDSKPSPYVVKSTRRSDTSKMDGIVTTTNKNTTTTLNIHAQVAMFMDTLRIAMTSLMKDHGYSHERAKISLLDQLITFTSTKQQQRETSMMDTISSTTTQNAMVPSSQTPSLSISDEKLFNFMRKTRIGMEHATIALTIEQTIASILNDPNLSDTSISDILSTWIQYLQHVQPKPLTYLMLKSSSPYGSSTPVLHIPTTTPIAVKQQQLEPTPTVVEISAATQKLKKPPSTPVSTADATNNGMPTSSHTRSKAGGKKSNNRIAISTPPLSTITISTATTPSTSSSQQQQRSRVDSVTEAVAAKMTATTSINNGDNSTQHISVASRGKPPLAPSTNGMSSASGAGSNVATTSLNSGSSGSKRPNMDSAATRGLDHPVFESSSSSRPASPSVLGVHSSSSANKRQRRATSMSSDN